MKKKGKKRAYYKVFVGPKDYCTCGPNIFKKYFKKTNDVKHVGTLRAKPKARMGRRRPSIAQVMLAIRSNASEGEIERCLELPFGYIKKCINEKREDPALLNILLILHRFPWMLEVADHNYNDAFAKKQLLKRGGFEIVKFANSIKV